LGETCLFTVVIARGSSHAEEEVQIAMEQNIVSKAVTIFALV
jgi:hypothetical protein